MLKIANKLVSRRFLLSASGALLASKSIGQTQGLDSYIDHAKERIAKASCQLISEKSTGTGFFFKFSDELRTKSLIGIVTNKHVAAMGSSIYFRHYSSGEAPTLQLDQFHTHFVPHPDPDVDLGVSFCVGALEGTPYIDQVTSLSFGDIPTHEDLVKYDDASRVLIAGYPHSLMDRSHGQPIFRSGVCATRPELRYDGKRIFYIDAAIWGGSSGSPVIMYDMQSSNIIGSPKPLLIGVVSATDVQNTYLTSYELGARPTIDPDRGAPNNLGLCVASDAIIDLATESLKKFPELANFGLSKLDKPRFQT